MTSIAPSATKTRQEPDEVDKRLERIRENIWPSDPYLMDLATSSSYHPPPHLANNWRRSCPFDKNEEQLQYMTFLPHTARGDTLLRTRGDWDDGNGNVKNDAAKRASGSSSGAISPSPGQPPRKKISLLDYKNKMAGQAVGKASPNTTRVQTAVADKIPQIAKSIAKPAVTVTEPTRSAPKKVAPLKLPEQKQNPVAPQGHKRSADQMADGQGMKSSDAPQASTASKRIQTQANKSQAPTAAPSVGTLGVHGLPRMLSPTLPACIEEQLAKLCGEATQVHAAQKQGSNGSVMDNYKTTARRTHTSDSPTAKANTKSKDTESQKGRTTAPLRESAPAPKLKVSSTGGNAKTLHAKEAATSRGAPTSNATADRVLNLCVDESKQNGKIRSSGASNGKHSLDAEKRLLVVLRIPKGLRKNCQRILQLQPQPRKSPAQIKLLSSSALQERPRDRPTLDSHDIPQMPKVKAIKADDSRRITANTEIPKAVANGLIALKVGEKRRQANADNEPPSKRQRPSAADFSKPRTPTNSALKSPGIPQHQNNHPQHQLSTPKTDRKSTAMDRVRSSEGGVKTLLGSMRSNTPVALNSTEQSSSREGRSSSNASGSSITDPIKKDEEAAVFKAEFTKYADLAKSLKREADTLAKLPDGRINTDSTTRRQGLAKAIETALCYMLAFTIKDEPARNKKIPADRTVWVSLLPYFKFLKTMSRGTESAQLQGFLYQLEAVCRDTIHQSDLERQEREGLTDETLTKGMAENGRLAHQAWMEGTRLLAHDDFRQNFPGTWAQRSKVPVDKVEKLLPERYGEGGYYLPLSNTSSNIEAVRVGWLFLEEWCKKEGVKWEGKMGL
ncbi:MAG: hypothetical protein Q9171_004346 [Xanthocarpia ochracea]